MSSTKRQQTMAKRERERAVERVDGASPELLVASRTARRCPRRQIREPLQQIALRTGDQPGVGEGLVVHGHRFSIA